ncbi:Dihydrolipoyl dehydrogenase, partial [Durusdinium trenchii]
AAQLGLKTACVEGRGRLGGTCLNVGCIPSKALLESSHHYHVAKHDFDKFGLEVDGLRVNFGRMMSQKDDVVEGLTSGIEGLFKKNKVSYIKGWGKIIGSNEVSVALTEGGNESIKAKNILIASGSEVTPLPPAPVDNEGKKIVDSTGALELDKIPDKMVVVGGGVIGLELGSVYSRLGTEVTVVEYMNTLCPGMDKELTKYLDRVLKKQGLKFKMKTKVTGTEVTDAGVKVTVEPAAGGDAEEIEADVVLVATGRRPYTAGLGLEELGIPLDAQGRVEVDEHFRTQVDGIWAIGDVIKGPMLAHKAEHEGIAAVETMAGMSGHINYSAIPGVIYTHPEVASVGATEEELKEAGVKFRKGKFNFMANSRGRAVQDTDGFVKVLADAETDRILGVHIVGPNAGEMIMEGVIAVEYSASSEDLARATHAHPTLSEAMKEACLACFSKPIHS